MVSRTTKVDLLAQDGKGQRIPLAAIPRTRSHHSHRKKLAKVDQGVGIVLL